MSKIITLVIYLSKHLVQTIISVNYLYERVAKNFLKSCDLIGLTLLTIKILPSQSVKRLIYDIKRQLLRIQKLLLPIQKIITVAVLSSESALREIEYSNCSGRIREIKFIIS